MKDFGFLGGWLSLEGREGERPGRGPVTSPLLGLSCSRKLKEGQQLLAQRVVTGKDGSHGSCRAGRDMCSASSRNLSLSYNSSPCSWAPQGLQERMATEQQETL